MQCVSTLAIIQYQIFVRKSSLMLKETTARALTWLKGIKDFHGSVEKSSLSRAQLINSHGVYVISCDNETTSLETSVRLYLEKDPGECEFWEFSILKVFL